MDDFFAWVIHCEVVTYSSNYCSVICEINQIHFLNNNYKCRLLQRMGKHTIHFGNMARIMNNGIKIIKCFQSKITFIFSFVNKKRLRLLQQRRFFSIFVIYPYYPIFVILLILSYLCVNMHEDQTNHFNILH